MTESPPDSSPSTGRSGRRSPPERAATSTPNNLPLELTSFVGREREMAEIGAAIEGARLVTLTGAGGCGKTRLAMATASGRLEGSEFPDGIWWVDLAPLTDGELVTQAVASALGVPEEPGSPLAETLLNAVEDRCVLLVVDNCEHLVEACREIVDALLRHGPGVTVLATSREPLGVAGEVTVPVPPLSLPHLDASSHAEAVGQSEAVQLFVERAAEALPGFDLTADNAAAVAEVCVRLDGIALAIELAAARVKHLTVRQIADRVDDCLKLLTRGVASDLPHHQTLRATIDWSHDLLEAPERAVLRRSSVFEGGFTLAAAEAVCPGDDIERDEVLDLLAVLLDKSMMALAEREEDHQARYRLLEPIRQYVEERLVAAGEEERARDRHLDYFLGMAEEAAEGLNGEERPIWLGRLEREHGNMRAALDWCTRADDGARKGLRLGSALSRFWSARGYASEARSQLEYFVARDEVADEDRLRSIALFELGRVATEQGDFRAAKTHFEACVAGRRRMDDTVGLARALSSFANAEVDLGNYDAAKPLYNEVLAVFKDLGLDGDTATVLVNLGTIALDHGELTTAQELFEEGLPIHQRLGQDWNVALAHANLGSVYHEQGELAAARTSYEESLRIWRDMGDRRCCAYAHIGLGSVSLEQDDLASARLNLDGCNALVPELEDQWIRVQAVEANGRLAALGGLPEPAAQLLGAAEAERERMGAPLAPIERTKCERAAAAAQDALGEASFAASWSVGRAMTIERAVDLAATIPAATEPQKPRTALQALKEEYGGLTAREREVASLLAQGLTNNQIAEALTVAPKTVERHVGNILSKLGFDNRAQVAAWAVEKGLAEAPEDLDTLIHND